MLGFVSSTTALIGQPLNSAFALESKAGVVISQTVPDLNFSIAFVAAFLSLKSKGTVPIMYWLGSLETNTHSNFVAWKDLASPHGLLGLVKLVQSPGIISDVCEFGSRWNCGLADCQSSA